MFSLNVFAQSSNYDVNYRGNSDATVTTNVVTTGSGEVESDSNAEIESDVDAETSGNTGSNTFLGIDTDLEIEERADASSNARVKLANGEQREIVVMPDEAVRLIGESSAGGEAQVRLTEENNKVVYTVESKKDARMLGIFKTKAKVVTVIDAETGEVISQKKPWWAVLISSKGNVTTSNNGTRLNVTMNITSNNTSRDDKITLCHVSGGNTTQTLTVSNSSLRAHLSHGDYLGTCIRTNQTGNVTVNSTVTANVTAGLDLDIGL